MKSFWEKWKVLAERVGNFQFDLFFSLLYFLIIVPLGFVTGLFTDFLKLNELPEWKKIDGDFNSIEKLREQ